MFGKKEKENRPALQEKGSLDDRILSGCENIRVELDQIQMSAKRMDAGLSNMVDSALETGQAASDAQALLLQLNEQADRIEADARAKEEYLAALQEDSSALQQDILELMNSGKHYTDVSKRLQSILQDPSYAGIRGDITRLMSLLTESSRAQTRLLRQQEAFARHLAAVPEDNMEPITELKDGISKLEDCSRKIQKGPEAILREMKSIGDSYLASQNSCDKIDSELVDLKDRLQNK